MSIFFYSVGQLDGLLFDEDELFVTRLDPQILERSIKALGLNENPDDKNRI